MKYGLRLVFEDRLLSTWRDKDGRYMTQGKRVGATCKLTPEERRLYVKKGAVIAIKHMMDSRGLGLAEAKSLFDEERGPGTRWWSGGAKTFHKVLY